MYEAEKKLHKVLGKVSAHNLVRVARLMHLKM